MTNQHDRRIAERTAHGVHVLRQRLHADLIGIDRQPATAMPTVVGVGNVQALGQLAPQVLPNEAVAGQPIAQ